MNPIMVQLPGNISNDVQFICRRLHDCFVLIIQLNDHCARRIKLKDYVARIIQSYNA